VYAIFTNVLQIHMAMADQPGDILVFLSGQEEIEAAAQYCEDTMKKLGNRCPPLLITQIYGSLPAEQQQLIFQPTPKGSRKVVISTNIAETSLTIDGIMYVIDTGVEKQSAHDSVTGVDSLVVVPCSRASAEQRAGRAGRTGPGKCFRLYPVWAWANDMMEQTPPEITRSNLDSVTLSLKAMGINDILNFDFMDPPSTTSLAKSLENLYSYGYIDSTGAVTKLGRRASELPLDPRLAKALLMADKHGCTSEVITIVAMVSEAGSLFFAPKDKKMAAEHAKARFFADTDGGDFIGYLKIFLEYAENEFSPMWCRDSFIQHRSLERVRSVREQLEKLCDKIEIEHSSCGASDHMPIMKAITSGFFHNVARLQRDGQTYRVVKNGMTVRIHPSSSLARRNSGPGLPKWVLFYELILSSAEFIRSISPIDPAWLLDAAPHVYKPTDLEKLGVDKKMGKGPGKVGVDR
jgi:pre-mRNA-splicing factor ATP-dependent RNA helicase DHX16